MWPVTGGWPTAANILPLSDVTPLVVLYDSTRLSLGREATACTPVPMVWTGLRRVPSQSMKVVDTLLMMGPLMMV